VGWTLGRYFFLRHVLIVTWFFLGIFALVYIVDFTELSRRMTDVPQFSVMLGLTLSAMRVPLVMLQTTPFIALFAGMATLIALNRRYELVIARAAGVSAWQFLRPVCLGALVFGVVAVGVLNPLAARGFAWAEQIENALLSKESRSVAAFGTPWLRQRADGRDMVIGAQSVLSNGLELAFPVFLEIDDAKGILERIDAERAFLRDGFWELTNARRLKEGEAPVEEKILNIPTDLRAEYVQERLARPETIPFFELPAKIEVARSFGLNAGGFAMQLNSLIALPFLLVAMTLVAATVSMRFVRMGQSGTLILGGVAAGFLLYVVSVLVKAFGTAGFVPPIVAAWIPVFLAMVFGVTFLLHREDG
jgi:lipopolysaccharide export system permease protein